LKIYRHEYLQAMCVYAEADLKNLSESEISIFSSIFKFDPIFQSIDQHNVGEKFSTERKEIQLLFKCLKHSLSNPKIANTFGISLLRKCVEIGFPYEVSPLLKLILQISKEEKIRTYAWQDILLKDKISLQQVNSEIAMEWLDIIVSYLPLSDLSIMCCLKYGHAIIQHTSLSSLILKSEIYSECMDTVLNFYTNCVRMDENVCISF
jgi:hypothetical protein